MTSQADPSDAPPGLRTRSRHLARRVRRAVLARRRLLAAACVGVAVLAGLRATSPVAPPRVEVPVLTRDVPAGAVLVAGDVAMVGYSPEAVPDGVVADPQGRMVAGPVARGEPITATRLLGPGLLGEVDGTGRPAGVRAGVGLTAMPVRFPDSAMAGLLRVGDLLDVLAVDPQGGEPREVSADARVLALPQPPASGTATDGLPGQLVVLGVASGTVTQVADASVRLFLTFAYAQ